MKIQSNQLIDELIAVTKNHRDFALKLLDEPDYTLNYRSSDNVWNAFECFEHLNLYGDFYLPEIENRINNNATKPQIDFKSGLLGNYFANSMLPKEKLNKMKTFKKMNPIHKNLDKGVLNEFIRQQEKTLELLEKARNVNLEKVKTSISISSLIKLKLGDSFRFLINHNTRHVEQAKRVMIEAKG